jgi:hypothetical protein
MRESIRSIVDLPIRQAPVAGDECLAIGGRVDDELEEVGQVEGRHGDKDAPSTTPERSGGATGRRTRSPTGERSEPAGRCAAA